MKLTNLKKCLDLLISKGYTTFEWLESTATTHIITGEGFEMKMESGDSDELAVHLTQTEKKKIKIT